MALNHITFYSKLMEMEMGIDVIIPENKWGYSLAERPKDYKNIRYSGFYVAVGLIIRTGRDIQQLSYMRHRLELQL